MPLYSFRNNVTGEEFEEMMSFSEVEEYLESNPHIEKYIGKAPSIIGGTGDRIKTDGGFNDVLSKIAEAHPASELADSHGKRTHAQTKIRDSHERVKKKLGGKIFNDD